MLSKIFLAIIGVLGALAGGLLALLQVRTSKVRNLDEKLQEAGETIERVKNVHIQSEENVKMYQETVTQLESIDERVEEAMDSIIADDPDTGDDALLEFLRNGK